MVSEDDLRNLIRPHLVFKASKFVLGKDWSQKDENGNFERDLWDKRVDVSFQSNAWVDTETNLYGLLKQRSSWISVVKLYGSRTACRHTRRLQ